MEILFTIAIFIVLVITGSFINRYIPRIPAALFQVMLGFFITYLPMPLHFEFESEAFMALVIATVLVVGSFINFIIPSISLGASFALAAILSPTDAVAVKSITKGMKLPKGLMAILEGESLLNDAAGIVSFKIALAAIITGTFSFANASKEFFIAAIGGMFLGIILGLVTISLKSLNRKFLNSEPTILVITQVILPILVYFAAEKFHLSGIIAVVFTGILLNFEKYLFQGESLNNQGVVSINYNQDTVSYILNGFVFVFLGYLLPDIFSNMMKFPDLDIKTGLLYVALITIALIISRFIFVYLFYLSFQPHTFNTSNKIIEFLKTKKLDVGNYSRFEYALISSLCGIHGTVTLATALMIPLTLESTGQPFPLRDAILFIASGVVLLSMIIGTIFLPITIKKEENEEIFLNNARSKILGEVIDELQTKYYNNLDTTPDLMGYAIAIKKLQEQQIYFCNDEKRLVHYSKKLVALIEKEEQKKINEILIEYENNRHLRHILEVRKWRLKKLLTYSVFKQLFITLKLSILEGKFRRLLVLLNLATDDMSSSTANQHRIEKHLRNRLKTNVELRQQIKEFRHSIPDIIDSLTYNAIDIIENQKTKENTLVIDFLKNIYDNFDYTLYNAPSNSYVEESRKFETEAIAMQKEKINNLKIQKKISHHEADTLLRDLNHNEALLYANIEE